MKLFVDFWNFQLSWNANVRPEPGSSLSHVKIAWKDLPSVLIGGLPSAGAVDKGAELIEEAVAAMVKEKKISIPRGGYLLTRGRNRVFVTRAAQD